VEEEMKIINEEVTKIKAEAKYKCPKTGNMLPHPFEFIMIVSGLKFAELEGSTLMLNHMGRAKSLFPDLISGYDLVNEEDFYPDVTIFAKQIIAAQEQEFTADSKGRLTKTPNCLKGMHTYMHAGETHDPHKKNLHDSVLLNAQRIGHGFQLALFPNLIEECKKRDICIEVCPLSNFVLGYTLDLRTHPARYLIANGV